jgi:hypothetical protein
MPPVKDVYIAVIGRANYPAFNSKFLTRQQVLEE